MTREEFIHKSLILGAGTVLFSSASCTRQKFAFSKIDSNFKGKVIVIGAGAAGLSAGLLLNQCGVDFQILEASSVIGGRLKKSSDFVDFPIDLGAEWIHTHPSVLSKIAFNKTLIDKIETIAYSPQTIQTVKNGKLKSYNFLKNFYSEWKFKNSTWFDFFHDHIAPDLKERILLNTPVAEIDYSSDIIRVMTASGVQFEADKVLITVPIKLLQTEAIRFVPELPEEKTRALSSVFMGDGLKVFVEFSERFYPDILTFGNIFKAMDAEEIFIYDAAFGKDSDKHVLGLFAINEEAKKYTDLADEEIIGKFLSDLDDIFNGKATEYYRRHIIQNWSKEPYIKGSYSYSIKGNKKNVIASLNAPVSEQLFFAGEALSLENQSMVHGACESAYQSVFRLLGK